MISSCISLIVINFIRLKGIVVYELKNTLTDSFEYIGVYIVGRIGEGMPSGTERARTISVVWYDIKAWYLCYLVDRYMIIGDISSVAYRKVVTIAQLLCNVPQQLYYGHRVLHRIAFA